MRERELLAVFDLAYQGFKDSVDEDAFPIRRLAALGGEFVVCSSNSKNFGLYGERVGALTVVASSPEKAQKNGRLRPVADPSYLLEPPSKRSYDRSIDPRR